MSDAISLLIGCILGVLLVAFGADWVSGLRRERASPFLFSVGDTVIRAPRSLPHVSLIALSRKYRRYKIVAVRRDWFGRKVYVTTHPDVAGTVKFRERELMENLN